MQRIDVHGILLRMVKYWTGSHTKLRLMVHIVWIPKYRHRVLKGELAKRIKELIFECADANRWKVEELNIQQDHVHLLLQFRPDVSVSSMVHKLKGKSRRIIRSEFPELKEFFGGTSFWADGFFAETSGQCSESAILAYIQNQ